MPSDEPSRPYNWRLKSLAKLKSIKFFKESVFVDIIMMKQLFTHRSLIICLKYTLFPRGEMPVIQTLSILEIVVSNGLME